MEEVKSSGGKSPSSSATSAPHGNGSAMQSSAESSKWTYAVAFALSLVVVAVGVYLAAMGKGLTLVAAGVVGVMGVLITWPIARALSPRGALGESLEVAMTPVYERMEQFSVMLNEISDQQLLSDRAKTVAYREKDREALRRAIQEDLAKRDWEAALVLVDHMDNQFGYKQEAERIREDINQRFAEHIRRQVQAGVALIDRHTANQQWAAAIREGERLQAQFPTIEDVRKLPNEIEQRRLAFKERLLQEYNEQVSRKDLDHAINTVRKLDFYLTPNEAAGMQDSVRNLFKDKLNQLKDEFTDSVHRSAWNDAYRIGDVIVRDYPNTQMATEIRDKLESLRRRASEPGAVTAPV